MSVAHVRSGDEYRDLASTLVRDELVGPTEPPSGTTIGVVRGGLWGIAGQAATLLASFFATAFVIRLLGSERFGVLILIQLLVGYLAVADLGMSAAATRFAAASYARGDEADESRVLWTAFALAALPAAIVVILFMPLADALAQLLRIPTHLLNDAAQALRLAALVLVARVLGGILSAPQLARLRLDTFTLVTSGFAVAQVALVPIALLFSPTLTAAVLVMVSTGLASAVTGGLVSLRMAPRLVRPSIELALAKPLAQFGAASVGMVAVGMVLLHFEKVWIVQLTTVTTLAYYSIAFTVARLTAILPGALSQPLLPALTRLVESQEPAKLRNLYERAFRLLFLAMAPLTLVLAVLAQPLLLVWAGPDFARESTMPLYVLLAGTFVDGLSYVPRTLLGAVAQPQRILRYHLMSLVPYVVVGALLVGWFGAVGAALAWSARAAFEATLLFRYSTRLFRELGHVVSAPISRFALALVLLAVPVAIASANNLPFAALTAVSLISLLAYVLYVVRKLLSPEERAWLMAAAMRSWMYRRGP